MATMGAATRVSGLTMALTESELRSFPRLQPGQFRETSPRTTSRRTTKYNCIAYAAGDVTKPWWPPVPNVKGYYWPPGAPVEETLSAFISAFQSLGYEVCDSPDYAPGFEKVALFAKPTGVPTHAATQYENGRWRSKLGNLEDIEHDLHAVECPIYGTVQVYMERPRVAQTEAN